jgi:hypothetical protein
MGALAAALAWHEPLLGQTSIVLDALGRWAPVPLGGVAAVCLWRARRPRRPGRLTPGQAGIILVGTVVGAAVLGALDGPLERSEGEAPATPSGVIGPPSDPQVREAARRAAARLQDPAVRAADAAIARHCEGLGPTDAAERLGCVLSFIPVRPALEAALRGQAGNPALADHLVACARVSPGTRPTAGDHPWDPARDCAPWPAPAEGDPD